MDASNRRPAPERNLARHMAGLGVSCLAGLPEAAGLLAAHATLAAACSFLAARASASTQLPLAPRVAGNHLKELERFLAVLIDECGGFRSGLARGRRAPVWQMPRDTGLPRSRNGVLTAHMPRLRAIGRLRHAACDGALHTSREGLWRDLAVASVGVDVGGNDGTCEAKARAAITITYGGLAEIAQFHLAIADELCARFAADLPGA